MINCPVCQSAAVFFTAKNDKSSKQCEYFKCQKCCFLFDKDLIEDKSGLQEKMGKIYQKDYAKNIDIGWKLRGDAVSKKINMILKIYKLFKFKKNIAVLDYGGGTGYITSKISNDFNVFYYDKYERPVHKGSYKILENPARANVVCAIEVVEHVTDIKEWNFISELCSDVLIFTTETTDGISNKDLINWEYLRSDVGHTCAYSLKSLHLLAKKHGFFYFFFPSKSFHIFLRNPFLKNLNFIKLEYPIYNFLRKIKNRH